MPLACRRALQRFSFQLCLGFPEDGTREICIQKEIVVDTANAVLLSDWPSTLLYACHQRHHPKQTAIKTQTIPIQVELKIAPNPGKKVQTAHSPTYNSLPKETQNLYQTPQQRPFFLKQSVLIPIHPLPMSNSVPYLTLTNLASPIHPAIQNRTTTTQYSPVQPCRLPFWPQQRPQLSSAQSKQPTAVFRNTSPHPPTQTYRNIEKKGEIASCPLHVSFHTRITIF